MNNFNRQDFSNYRVIDSQQTAGSGTIARKFMANVFMWMFVALGVSAFFAFLYASSPSLISQLYEVGPAGGLRPTTMWWIVSLAPLGFVLVMGGAFYRLSANTMTLLFVGFAALMGISLSNIFLVYSASSIIGCFGSSAAMFGIMAFMGYTTDKDLTSFGRILTMGLIGILIAFLVNAFLHSALMSYVISIVGVAVFTGLTAYDVQKLKRIGAGVEYNGVGADDTRKTAIMGAMSLYLDFVNLFLFMLRLFGNRRN